MIDVLLQVAIGLTEIAVVFAPVFLFVYLREHKKDRVFDAEMRKRVHAHKQRMERVKKGM